MPPPPGKKNATVYAYKQVTYLSVQIEIQLVND